MPPGSSPNLRAVGAAMLAAGAAACGLLSGCVPPPFKDAQVDPRSPIAAEVATTVRPGAAYPTFIGFPAKPTGVRPLKQYGVDAAAVEADGATLVRMTAENTWTITDTEAFAAQAQLEARPALPPANPAETAAFANDQKARAKSPPPIKR